MALSEDLLDSIVTGVFELKQYITYIDASPELHRELIHIDNAIDEMVENLKEDLGIV